MSVGLKRLPETMRMAITTGNRRFRNKAADHSVAASYEALNSTWLGMLRTSPGQTLAMFAAPVLFVLLVFGVVMGIRIYVQDRAFATMRRLEVSITGKHHELSAKFPDFATDSDLTSALPSLKVLGVASLDLSGTKVTTLPPLQGLTSLQALELSCTKLTTLPSLQGLTALQTLDLRDSLVSQLPPLQELAALKYLDLTGSRVRTDDPEVQQLRVMGVTVEQGRS